MLGKVFQTGLWKKSHSVHGTWHIGTRLGADQLDAWLPPSPEAIYTELCFRRSRHAQVR